MSRASPWLYLLSLGSLSLVGPLAVHLFLPAMPAVKAEFRISDDLTQLTFSMSMFAMAISTLLYGALSDRYGRRPVLLAGLGLFLVGSAMSAAAGSLATLMAGRLVQAIGAGCGATIGRAIARDKYGQEELVRVIAYLSMFYTVGPMISPVVSGLMLDHFGWRWVFAFSLVAGALISGGAMALIEETHPASARDTSGGVAEIARTMLSDWVLLFRYPRFAAFVLQAGFNTGVFFTLSTASAVLMKEQLGRSGLEFGLYFLMFPLGYLTGNLISARISRFVSIEAMVLGGAAVLAVSVAFQTTLLAWGHVSPATLFLPGFVLTLAQGISLPSGQAGAIATVPRIAGTAAGVGVFVQTFVGAGMVQLYGHFANGTVRPLIASMLIGTICAVICGVVPWVLRARGRVG